MTDTPPIQVGTMVLARRRTGVCDPGEIGVCYEVYALGGRPGYGFLFEKGHADGFSPDDVRHFLLVTDEVCPSIATYTFTSVIGLQRDFKRARFQEAFGPGGTADEASGLDATRALAEALGPAKPARREGREHGGLAQGCRQAREHACLPAHNDAPLAHTPARWRAAHHGTRGTRAG
jgi:hypothetical protein